MLDLVKMNAGFSAVIARLIEKAPHEHPSRVADHDVDKLSTTLSKLRVWQERHDSLKHDLVFQMEKPVEQISRTPPMLMLEHSSGSEG